MPPLAQTHVDQLLTNISVMYRNGVYVGQDMCPILPVEKRSDLYAVYTKEDFLSASPLDAQGRPTSLRGLGVEAAEIDFSVSKKPYFCNEYSYRGLVTDAEREIADSPLSPDIDQTTQVTERLWIDNEVVTAAMLFGDATYATANKKLLVSGAGTNKGDSSWNANVANTSPLTNIKNARTQIIAGIARDANTISMGYDTALTLAETTEIKDLLKYTDPNMVSGSGLPKVIRGLRPIVGMAQRNVAQEGATYSGGYIWQSAPGGTASGAALVCYIAPNPGLRMVSIAYTFDCPDDTTHARGVSVRKYRVEARKGNMVEASFTRDYRPIAVDGSTNGYAAGGYATAGFLIQGTTL